MTIGISKEDLKDLLEINLRNYDEDDPTILTLRWIMSKCEELDTWLPIDEAPKDKSILLLLDSGMAVTGYWSTHHWVTDIFDEFDCGNRVTATHYKLLPEGRI